MLVRIPYIVPALALVLACLGWGCEGSRAAPQPASAEAAPEMDQEQLDRLRSIGYVGSIESYDKKRMRLGLLGRDPARADPGLVYYNSFGDCSGILVDGRGRELRRWGTENCARWGHSILLEDGGVLAIHKDDVPVSSPAVDASIRSVVRFSWEGEEMWRSRLPAHHDIEVTPSGDIAVLLFRQRRLPELHTGLPVRDDAVALLGAQGAIVEEVSLLDVLRGSPDVLELQPVAPAERAGGEPLEVDPLHANSIEWMRRPELTRRAPFYSSEHVLFCLRHQDSVGILHWPTRRLVWAWGRGELSGPHDATVLSNGNILIFDNGIARSWSRIVELDPVSRTIVWEYRAPRETGFYSLRHGSSQRLANGNTLITDSGQARIFEVTSAGETVWDFRNPRRDPLGKPIVVYRARRVTPADGPPFLRSD